MNAPLAKSSGGLRAIGTHREIADRNLTRYRESLARAEAGGRGDADIIRRKLNDWLDYRHRHQQNGTLDEMAYL